jgi:hypothetical protein
VQLASEELGPAWRSRTAKNPIIAKGKPPESGLKIAILQIGYRLNRNRYKWNEVEDELLPVP